jgi:hypothetical protein
MKVPSSRLPPLLSLLLLVIPVDGFLQHGRIVEGIGAKAVQQSKPLANGLPSHRSATEESEDFASLSRRSVLALPTMIAAQYALSAIVIPPGPSEAAQDAKREKFRDARKNVQYLLDHYDEIISKGGGDNVRRYLGTVVTDSPMVGIMKVLKDLQGEADDIVEYTESMDDFEYSLRAADTAVYSANFVTFSSAKTKPEEYFDNAFKEIKKMLSCMDAMAGEINLT